MGHDLNFYNDRKSSAFYAYAQAHASFVLLYR